MIAFFPEDEPRCSSCRDLPQGTSTGACSAVRAARAKYRQAAEAIMVYGESVFSEPPPKLRPPPLPVPHFRWPRPVVFQRRAHRQLARKKRRF